MKDEYSTTKEEAQKIRAKFTYTKLKDLLTKSEILFDNKNGITDANEENGCMRMWSGSHKDNLKEHDQKFNQGNLLTRGQTVQNVPKEKTTPLVLTAGQMSLHHPTTVHGSGLNKSDDRRIGFVIQSYIGANVKQVLGKNSVQLARGIDNYNFHEN